MLDKFAKKSELSAMTPRAGKSSSFNNCEMGSNFFARRRYGRMTKMGSNSVAMYTLPLLSM